MPTAASALALFSTHWNMASAGTKTSSWARFVRNYSDKNAQQNMSAAEEMTTTELSLSRGARPAEVCVCVDTCTEPHAHTHTQTCTQYNNNGPENKHFREQNQKKT